MSALVYHIAASPINGAERGLIALSDIQANTLILEEAPLLHINTQIAPDDFELSQFLLDETNQQSRIIQSEMQALNQSNRANWILFRSLHTGVPARTAMREQDIERIRRNAFSYYFQDQKWITTYHDLCKANHSCRPNAVVDIAHSGHNRGRARLIATASSQQTPKF